MMETSKTLFQPGEVERPELGPRSDNDVYIYIYGIGYIGLFNLSWNMFDS